MRSRDFLILLILASATFGTIALYTLTGSIYGILYSWANPAITHPMPNIDEMLFWASIIVLTPLAVLWWLYFVFNVVYAKKPDSTFEETKT